MDDANVTCPNCSHTFSIRDDLVAKVNYIGTKIDFAADVLTKAIGEMSANPMLASLLRKSN